MSTETVLHQKLVRDRIPEIIRANGDEPSTRVLVSDDDYVAALYAKLTEEIDELRAAPAAEQLGELADVLETLLALTRALGHADGALTEAARTKRADRGGFDRRLWLESVDRTP